jgi:hypothetical protein
MFWAPGEKYLKKEIEHLPLIQEFLIPNCWHVGFKHRVESDAASGALRMVDENKYEDREITDDEFRALRIESRE